MLHIIAYAFWAAREERRRKRWSHKQLQDLLPDYTGELILGTLAILAVIIGLLILRTEAI